jgi:hypothetical protein
VRISRRSRVEEASDIRHIGEDIRRRRAPQRTK